MTLRSMFDEREANASELRAPRSERLPVRYTPYTRSRAPDTPTSGFSTIDNFMGFVRQLNFTSSETDSTSTSPASPRSIDDDETEYESDHEVPRTPPRGRAAPPPSPSFNVTPSLRAASVFDEDIVPFNQDMVGRFGHLDTPQSPGSQHRAASPSLGRAIFDDDTMPFDQEMEINNTVEIDVVNVADQPPQLETSQSSTSENESSREPDAQPYELYEEEANRFIHRIRTVPIEQLMEPAAVQEPPQQQQLDNVLEAEQRSDDAEPHRHPTCPCCLEDLLTIQRPPVVFNCGHLTCDYCLDRLFEVKARERQPYQPMPRIQCPSCRKEVQFVHKIYF